MTEVRAHTTLSDLLVDRFSKNELKLLPKGWQILGDIITLSISPSLETRKCEIGEALLKFYPRCKTVLRMGRISGPYREPDVEIIAGDDTETIHKENGCRFKLDATKIMFSPGNLDERKRMSMLDKDETIVDMFAGIGYFSIPMAVHSRPKKIVAIEINPLAYHYLCENVRLNKVADIIQPVHGDCATKTPVGIADRVIMGSFEAFHYLIQGINALKPNGILHYHETTPEKLVFDRPIKRVEDAANELDRVIKIQKCRKVKKYSPGVWHVVVDAQVF
ncbi:MAG: class I SAM-dependent methyltransferase family protein [Methanocellales archaeon]|nr:class I SAM-dependent methyltransferase family protein [Methanocellales archaeon]